MITKLEVYDLECLSNLFTYTGYNIKEKKYYQFVICKWRNDYLDLINHLKNDDMSLMQIGFNNESYDYPLEHHLIKHFNIYKDINGEELAQQLYKKSQDIINMEFSAIADKNKYIPQLDLYKIWHFNNKARACSLKDLEIAMCLPNVEEMPLHHTHWCKKGDEDLILEYNLNDVFATYKFFLVTLGKTDYSIYKGEDKIKLRQNIKKQFGVNVLNFGDVPMGYQLILNLYSRASGIPIPQLKQLKTPREQIALKECIPKWCNIQSEPFKKFVNTVNNTIINPNSSASVKDFGFSILTHEYKFDFGGGGCHGCCKPGVYESNNEWVIVDYDIGSLYPSIAKSLGLYPEHLGPTFLKLYEKFIDDRLTEKHKPKNGRNQTLIKAYKLILNGAYGKSKEESSFLYDPLYTFKTTIAGQCFICMWSERWIKAVPEVKFLQSNTDGQTILIPRSKLHLIREVNEQLTKETGLTIEEVFYKKMIIRDVNNYIGVYDDYTPENNHCKLKGCFEIDKEYYKDPSMKIVPISLKKYFVDNIPIKETITNHKNIFDFCLRLKTNSKSIPYFRHLNEEGIIVDDKLDRTTRYYISNTGGILLKDFNGKLNGVNVGFSAIIFNKYIEKDFKDYNINYRFYIAEANKIKNVIEDYGQLSLF